MKQNEKNPVFSVLLVALCAVAEIFMLAAVFEEHIEDQAARLFAAFILTAMTMYAMLFRNKLALICIISAIAIPAIACQEVGGPIVVILASYFFHSLFANEKCKHVMREWVLDIFRDEKEVAE